MVGTNAVNDGSTTRFVLQHNRITLPQDFVDSLALKYGDKVAVSLSATNSIIVKALAKTAPLTAITKKKKVKPLGRRNKTGHKKHVGLTQAQAVTSSTPTLTKKRRKSLLQVISGI